jgi:hypothetical protein
MSASSGHLPNPLWRPLAILLTALALSIGWGIRGNYGHETGAMFPGALAAIAVCLLSGREDWRERIAYFACFGALGWAFGGSISYMQVITYTQSGNAASQFYGYWALFVIGFLWAALGGAGTALPAVLDRKSLCDLFRPLSLLLALWCVLYFVEKPLTQMVQKQFELRFSAAHAAQRHESVLYWLDSDWLPVLVILCGILVFDLVDRRFTHSLWLPVFAAVGTGLGWLASLALFRAGWSTAIGEMLVHYQGDATIFDQDRLVTNWPVLAIEYSRAMGAVLGLAGGIGAYFVAFGKFRRGSALFLHMAVGWFVGFLLLPVLLDIRMTPPRGDNWAGILGVYGGALVYFIRNKLWPIVVASLVTGTIGGIGFSGIACLEGLLESFGNKNRVPRLAEAWTQWQKSSSVAYPPDFAKGLMIDERWKFWQQANWHSVLEQSYGFVNGLAVVAGIALILRRVAPLNNEAKRYRWTEIVAVTLALPVVLYVNFVKNVADWSAETPPLVPQVMRVPLIGFPISATGWFNVFFGCAALALVTLLCIHSRRRLALLDQSWLGRGQMFFLVLMWTFLIASFGKALGPHNGFPGFREGRLITEGTITLNVVLATLMILLVPRTRPETVSSPPNDMRWLVRASVLFTVLCAILIPPLEAVCTRSVYGDAPGWRTGGHGPQMRFGPKAEWKHWPLLKGAAHS